MSKLQILIGALLLGLAIIVSSWNTGPSASSAPNNPAYVVITAGSPHVGLVTQPGR